MRSKCGVSVLKINAAKQVQMRTFGWSIGKLLVSAHVKKEKGVTSKSNCRNEGIIQTSCNHQMHMNEVHETIKGWET